MQQPSHIQKAFRQILIRSITLPLLTGLLSGMVFVVLISLLLRQNKEVERADQVISLTHANLNLFVDAETGLRGYALTGKSEFLEPYILSSSSSPEKLEELRRQVNDNKIQLERVIALQGLHKNWLEYAENIKQLKSQNKNVALIMAQGVGKSMMDKARVLFGQITVTEERLRKEASDFMNFISKVVLLGVILFSLVSGLLIAFYGRRQIMSLSSSYERVLHSSQEHNLQLQYQQWLKTAQNELNEQMINRRSLQGLSETIISYLADYLNAQVGAIYLTKDEQILERIAGFALPPEVQQLKSVAWGETLVGQVALQKKQMLLKEVPPNYIKVSSSSGEALPAELFLFPLLDEEDVVGVIELGFLNSADPHVVDFFSTLQNSIITAIKTAQFRDQREKLLLEIQNQSEELQTQQEEMQVTNEELEQQTVMLRATQTRLEAQHAEMEQTNAQLEEQARTLENQKDLLDRKNESLIASKLELEHKALELQRVSQYKSEFLANMSHELRTPLNSSLILAKLLTENKDKNLNDQQIEFAQQILSACNDLLNLINDILDLSKVESGKLDIHPDEIRIENLLQGLRKAFEPIAREKGLDLKFEAGPDTPIKIFTDRMRLEQILKNLISNALKFTPQGSVIVRASSDTHQHICFEVIDTGIGIKREQQEVIFEAFRQADGTTNRRFGGTGLGLSISRDLAELLGGTIKVNSVFEHGSTFFLQLPIRYQTIKEQMPELHPTRVLTKLEKLEQHQHQDEKKSKRFFEDDRVEIDQKHLPHILVMEDDKKFAQILYDLAHENKYKCIVVDSAEEGIDLALKYHPVAVLLDIKLTGQNGLFALDQLKQHSETRHIPVHVISVEDFSRQALHMGAMGYMLKPVRREQLVEAFSSIESAIHQNIRKVLIVEDNQIQSHAIQKLIEDKNIKTTAVESAGEAFKLLEKNSYDCMITDLNLPDMTGFELLEKMNQNPNKAYPPVIVYTGRSLSREEEIQLNRYSRSVIVKGAKSPERLLDEVSLFLHRVESSLDEQKKDMLENLRNREKIFADKTIMIVDDDMRNTFALTAALEQKGARIVIAKNGEESISKLKQEKNVDIVLMDIMMPVMDGYEAIREIRKDSKYKKLPIIALTAMAMKDDQQLCLQAGANDYLSKPVDLDKLLSLIRIWLTAGWS